jgi:hypothetical protein
MKTTVSSFILIVWVFFSFFTIINAQEDSTTTDSLVVATGACTTTDTASATSCEEITQTECTTKNGTYGGDNTTCEDNTTETVNMGAPTGDSVKFDFAEKLLLNNTDPSRANLVKNRYSSVAAVVNLIIRYLFLAGGVVFFVLILISGYKLVFLGDKQKALSDVKKNLTTGVLGLLIMFAVFWIIKIIEALTGLSILGTFGL